MVQRCEDYVVPDEATVAQRDAAVILKVAAVIDEGTEKVLTIQNTLRII